MQVSGKVVFTTSDGDCVVGVVKKVWRRQDGDVRPPLINIQELKSGKTHTSVPPESDVPGASGYFYSCLDMMYPPPSTPNRGMERFPE